MEENKNSQKKSDGPRRKSKGVDKDKKNSSTERLENGERMQSEEQNEGSAVTDSKFPFFKIQRS